ncbi:MAG TPA: hypothetical protein VK665_00935, partial [Candidatus Elarobacter sp.]|nr:hypothetical protein [Candidatus Elarobacter sp.]
MTSGEAAALEALIAVVAAAAGFALGRSRPKSPAGPPNQAAPEPQPEGRFDQLMRSITVGVVTLDANGYITGIN